MIDWKIKQVIEEFKNFKKPHPDYIGGWELSSVVKSFYVYIRSDCSISQIKEKTEQYERTYKISD